MALLDCRPSTHPPSILAFPSSSSSLFLPPPLPRRLSFSFASLSFPLLPHCVVPVVWLCSIVVSPPSVLVFIVRIGVHYGGIMLASLFNTLAFGVQVFIVIVVARSQWCCQSHIPQEREGADRWVYENLPTSLGRGGVHAVGCQSL